MLDSPYRPGFGVRPQVLAGRESLLARAAADLVAVRNTRAAAPSVTVYVGPRGLGKTVTLDEIAGIAERQGFVVGHLRLDSVSDNIQLLASEAAKVTGPLQGLGDSIRATLAARLKALSVEIDAGVVKITSDQPKQRGNETVERQVLADILANAARLALTHGRPGLALFIDELQEPPREQLVVLCHALQDVLTSRPAPPLIVFAAGLPATPDKVVEAASFTERFDFRPIRRLDQVSAQRALLEPALASNVQWDPDAANRALHAAAGSPYLIQRIGDEAWRVTAPDPSDTITPADVDQALLHTQEGLETGMFRGRWSKTTPVEQEVLAAMAYAADDTGTATTSDITAATGRTTPQLSMVRKSLIDKGLIETAGKGRWQFTMPGFAEYIRRQNEPDTRPPGQAWQVTDKLAIDPVWEQMTPHEHPPPFQKTTKQGADSASRLTTENGR